MAERAADRGDAGMGPVGMGPGAWARDCWPAAGRLVFAARAAAEAAGEFSRSMGQSAAGSSTGTQQRRGALAADDTGAARRRARSFPELAENCATAAGIDPSTMATLPTAVTGAAGRGTTELSRVLGAAAGSTSDASSTMVERDPAATHADVAESARPAHGARAAAVQRTRCTCAVPSALVRLGVSQTGRHEGRRQTDLTAAINEDTAACPSPYSMRVLSR